MPALFPDSQLIFGPRDFFKVLALGFGLAILQCFMIARIGFPGFGPEWGLALAVYVCLRSDLWVAALAAFFLGLIRDVTGGMWLGLWSLQLVMIIWLFHPYRARLNFFNPLTLTPLIFILSIGGYLFIMTPLMAILGWPSDKFNPLPAFFTSALLTALTSPLLFTFLDWLTRDKDSENG